jgi:hypothetical protein
MRLRQVAWVARDLADSTKQVRANLQLDVCYSDPGVGLFGLENVLFPVGDQFLEIVSPVADDTTAGRLLDKRDVSSAGYMVIFQTEGDLDDVRARAEAAGIRIVFEAPGGSDTDGTAIHGIHFHPADIGGAIVSIDRSEQPEEWAWAGPDWRSHVQTGVVSAMVGVTIEADDPDLTASAWAQLLGVERDAMSVVVDDAMIRFVAPEPGERARGVIGLDFAGSSPTEFDLVGTIVSVVDVGGPGAS